VNVATLVRLAAGKRPKARVWTDERVTEWRSRYELATEGMRLQAERLAVWKRLDMRPSPVMVWTAEQTGAFLDAIAGHRLYPLFHLITFRGLRRGEAAGLRWVDVDLHRAVVSIQTQLVQIGWSVRESTPQSEASDALVALDQATLTVLRAWRKAQVTERMEWRPAWTDTGRVFTHEDGRALHSSFVTALFERLAFKAGLPPIREHDLRHGAASLARAGGADMKAIQAMLRHSSLGITADTYTSLFADEGHAVAEAVASVVPRKAVAGEASETVGPHSVPAVGPKVIRRIR
jgi:integrase